MVSKPLPFAASVGKPSPTTPVQGNHSDEVFDQSAPVIATHIPEDKARRIPLSTEITEREKANIIGLNEIWNVAADLDNTLTRFMENVRFLADQNHADAWEPLYWVQYLTRALPILCADNRDRLMKAARLMADANGVQFQECQKDGMPAGMSWRQALLYTYAAHGNDDEVMRHD